MKEAKSEVFRYLGRKNSEVSQELDLMVSECMSQMRETAVIRSVYKEFEMIAGGGGLIIVGTDIVLSESRMVERFCDCEKAVLLAVTLGVKADGLIRRYENADITRALILDACAAQLVERATDEIEEKIRESAKESGFLTLPRFGPGYTGMPINIQPMLLSAVKAEKSIGLTCTENFILLPRKSVTAIIGLGKNLKRREATCLQCSLYNNCRYGKGQGGCPE